MGNKPEPIDWAQVKSEWRLKQKTCSIPGCYNDPMWMIRKRNGLFVYCSKHVPLTDPKRVCSMCGLPAPNGHGWRDCVEALKNLIPKGELE